MRNIDLYEFFLREQEEEEQVEDPNQQIQTQNQGAPPQNQAAPNPAQDQTPAQQTKQLKGDSGPFSDFEESVIENISFSRTSAGGGALRIKLRKQGRPLIISWENNRTIVQKPNGDIVTLG